MIEALSPTFILKDFIERALKGLCRNSEMAKVEIIDSGGKTLCIVLSCDPSDVPLLIGRSGHNIKALRTLVCSMAKKHGYNPTIIVNE